MARGPVMAGMVAVAGYQLAFFSAVARTGVAVGTMVAIGSAPVLAGLLAWLVRGEQPPGRWYARDHAGDDGLRAARGGRGASAFLTRGGHARGGCWHGQCGLYGGGQGSLVTWPLTIFACQAP